MQTVLKALAHPMRRDILAMLRAAPCNASQIADKFDVTKPTVSGHLNILMDADLISQVRNGTTLTYHIRLSVLEETLGGLMGMFDIGNNNEKNGN
ncbi:MAG: helix-turn-helix transcriptional regulator [Rhizobiales bacterium]|nr:metalloregulator ArsR/SmtB family transcription factor [Hyphomicrobiales bacterium]NRB12931.1 helix-turn-helix transcriptional regulator [Hyphomicrobiales bacterium]